MAGQPILQLRNLTKVFGNFTAVNDIDLDFEEGEFFTIVGPSGSGKTTLLRMLTGMEFASSGDILLRGQRINDLPANKRPTCMVFQSLALFPHRSVGQNIEFSLKMKGVDPAARKIRALELMAQLRLPETYYSKNVTKCSGGERQRVALARALAYEPDILFFDEPLSAIDYKLRKTLEKELKDIHRETGKTFIYITHSLEEAMVMSDRIGVMRAGKLVQVGSPQEIYSAPQTKFVSEFIGDVNVIAVTANGAASVTCRGTRHQPKVPSRACRIYRRLSGGAPGIPAFCRQSRRSRTTVSKAASTTNMCSVLASSTRCGSAITYSSSRNCASRPLGAAGTTKC